MSTSNTPTTTPAALRRSYVLLLAISGMGSEPSPEHIGEAEVKLLLDSGFAVRSNGRLVATPKGLGAASMVASLPSIGEVLRPSDGRRNKPHF